MLRAYSAPQIWPAYSPLERAGFRPVELYSQSTFAPANADDTIFTVVGPKTDRAS